MRAAVIERTTKETSIKCMLNIDGTGRGTIDTGIGFFNHMMELFAFHSGFELTLTCKGDVDVDDHHSIEDCGIALGQALHAALGDKRGIARYGFMSLPMDETLANVSLDISGRPYLVLNCQFHREKVGEMATEMVEEFLRALCVHGGLTLHVNVPYGKNDHHQIEAIFKGLGRALKAAVKIEGDALPSTKGML